MRLTKGNVSVATTRELPVTLHNHGSVSGKGCHSHRAGYSKHKQDEGGSMQGNPEYCSQALICTMCCIAHVGSKHQQQHSRAGKCCMQS